MTLVGSHVVELAELARSAPGWRDLLAALRADLESLDVDVHVDQVKEKFGGLRFYYTLDRLELTDAECAALRAVDGRVEELVDAAEMRSYAVCFLCGATSGIHRGTGHWTRYFCAAHDTVDLRRTWSSDDGDAS